MTASVDRFWKRWSKEYLLELRQHHKINRNARTFNAKKGDAVLIQEDNVKRHKWGIGVIDDFVVGRDGVVRGAAVRKIGGDGRRRIIHRPLQKLYPLEISCSRSAENVTKDDVDKSIDADPSTQDTVSDDVLDNTSSDSTPVAIRQTTSKRTAAVRGESQRRKNEGRQT